MSALERLAAERSEVLDRATVDGELLDAQWRQRAEVGEHVLGELCGQRRGATLRLISMARTVELRLAGLTTVTSPAPDPSAPPVP